MLFFIFIFMLSVVLKQQKFVSMSGSRKTGILVVLMAQPCQARVSTWLSELAPPAGELPTSNPLTPSPACPNAKDG